MSMTRATNATADSEPQPSTGVPEPQPGAGVPQPAVVEAQPLLQITNSDATPEEIAALVAVFSALGVPAVPRPRRTPEWQSHHRKLRAPIIPGPGGWRSSGLPR